MWATRAVAAGVALEGVELVHNGIIWIKRRKMKQMELAHLREVAEIFPVSDLRIKTESTGSDHAKWVKVLGRIGLIAVVVGVVAESWYGVKLEDAHNAIHALDMTLLTAAQKDAGDARISSEDAAIASKQARLDAEAATREAKAALEEVNGVRTEVSNVKGEADALGKQLSIARESLNTLGKELDAEIGKHQPRRVTDSQATCIKNALKDMRGQSVKLQTFRDAEAEPFTFEIAKVFEQALGQGHVDFAFLPQELRKRSGIEVGSDGGTFGDAVRLAIGCITPGASPGGGGPEGRVVQPTPHAGENPVLGKVFEIIVWPDPGRSPR
jgi:hypothetical protein